MCILNILQQKIHSHTNGGDDIARFLAETMRGETPAVKVNHRIDAAKQLIKFGFDDDQAEKFRDLIPKPEELAAKKPMDNQSNQSTSAKPVSHIDILNYGMARLIRDETADGHTIVKFLLKIMNGSEKAFLAKKMRIKPADRMAAARELLRRGFGDFSSTRRSMSASNEEANSYDTLHADLAKRMREYSEHGADTVRFLLEVMSDPDPEEEFTVHHRMSAAQELLRRGWDTNFDAITSDDVAGYWQEQTSPRLSVGQKKSLAGLSAYVDEYDEYDDVDYEAIARRIREEEDRQVAAQKSVAPRQSRVVKGKTKPVSQDDGAGDAAGDAADEPYNADEYSRSAIIREYTEAVGRGDEEAASRAEDKFYGRDTEIEYPEYGPTDEDPTVDYFYEPLSPEEQAKFDEELRQEHDEPAPVAVNGKLTSASAEGERHSHPVVGELIEPRAQEDPLDFMELAKTAAPRRKSDPLVQLMEAAAVHGLAAICPPPTRKRHKAAIRSP